MNKNTPFSLNIIYGCLWNQNEGTWQNLKVNAIVFHGRFPHGFVPLLFLNVNIFTWAEFLMIYFFSISFNESSWSSQQFITKWIKFCSQRRNICFLTCWICTSMICVSMILLCTSIFGFVQLTAVENLLPLQPFDRKYFSVKLQTHPFSQLLTENKSSWQLLAALQNLGPAENPKPYTWSHSMLLDFASQDVY